MAVWSEVPHSIVSKFDRWDSDFYQLKYQNVLQKIESSSPQKIGILDDFIQFLTNGHTPLRHDLSIGDVAFLTAENIYDFDINYNTEKRILLTHHNEELKRTQLNNEDFLITIKGRAGNVAIAENIPGLFNINQDVALFHLTEEIPSYYLLAFLNSPLGKAFSEQYSTGQINPFLGLGNLRLLPIPVYKKELMLKIADNTKKIVSSAYKEKNNSNQLYSTAQSFLLKEIGFKESDYSHIHNYEGSFKDIQIAGRMDAEYFQPKYKNLLDLIKKSKQAIRLGDYLVDPASRGIQPIYDDKGDITIINSQHVGKQFIELKSCRKTTMDFVKRNNSKGWVKKFDVLLNSTGVNTIGRAQTYLKSVAGVVDGHVTIIRPKEALDPIFLGVFLNSPLGFLQTERGWTGSSGQIELRADVIEDYAIWLAPKRIQQKIRELILEAQNSFDRANLLFEKAASVFEQYIFQ